MKISTLTLLLAATVAGAHAEIKESAKDAVKNMGVGWNLGNTLDASKSKEGAKPSDASYWGTQGVESETYWGQAITKPELMTMMKNAGFDAIRVPITWYNHMDKDGKVDAAWMKRVHEIVDYVIDNGLYCIINVHHDTGADSNTYSSWIKADEENYKTNKARFEGLWTQIANEFKDYDEHLLFAGYNEMLDIKSSWCFASFAATGQYDAAIAESAYKGINNYAQSFVNTVRATGGNNKTRNLIVPTYAAACGEGNWNKHLSDPLSQMNLPKDETSGHIIFEVHTYPNISSGNITSIKSNVDQIIKTINDNLVSKGAPVIFGEWGTSNVDASVTDYDARKSLMFQFVDYFVQQTKANGMGTFYWMGLTDGMYRSMPAFNQPDLAERIAKAYHGSDFKGEYPEPAKSTSYDLVSEPMKFMNWGDPRLQISKEYFQSIEKDIQLTLTYTFVNDNEDMQFFYGDWSSKPDFIVDEEVISGDYFPHVAHADTETCTTTFKFSEAVCKELTKRGLILFGHNFTVTKAVLSNAAASGIEEIEEVSDAEGPVYNLFGQQSKAEGFVIRNGKVLYVK